mgnify:FL=1
MCPLFMSFAIASCSGESLEPCLQFMDMSNAWQGCIVLTTDCKPEDPLFASIDHELVDEVRTGFLRGQLATSLICREMVVDSGLQKAEYSAAVPMSEFFAGLVRMPPEEYRRYHCGGLA